MSELRQPRIWLIGLFSSALLASCGSTPVQTVIPTPVPNIPAPIVTPTVDVQSLRITNQNWGAVQQRPTSYVGARVALSGEIFNVERSATEVGIQIWTDPLHAEGNTVVVFPLAGSPSVGIGDRVDVEGKVVGEFVGSNDSGKELKLPKVEADRVEVASRATPSPSAAAAAAAPSAKPAASASASASPISAGYYRVAGTASAGLTVRQSPSSTAGKLGLLAEGVVVEVVDGAPAGWAHVQGTGFNGYAARSYLSGPVARPSQSARLTH